EYLNTATPLSEHVKVDLEMWGCPVSKGHIREVIVALLNGRNPSMPSYTVCLECKRRGAVCVLVDNGTPCLGPVTRAGCGAICPSCGRGCYGCFGPAKGANLASLSGILERNESRPGETAQLLRGISGNAAAFRNAAAILTKARPE
ncbi:MAG TPA: hypothetical protein VIV15_03615, partial [Anaerolineales bacterium]